MISVVIEIGEFGECVGTVAERQPNYQGANAGYDGEESDGPYPFLCVRDGHGICVGLAVFVDAKSGAGTPARLE